MFSSAIEHNFSWAYVVEARHFDVATADSGYCFDLEIDSGASGYPVWYFNLDGTIKSSYFTLEMYVKGYHHTNLHMNFVDSSNTSLLLHGNKSITLTESWQKYTVDVVASDFNAGKSALDIDKIKFSTDCSGTAGNTRNLRLDQLFITDIASKDGSVAYNVEMCNDKGGTYSNGSTFGVEHVDTVGLGSARKVTFENSTGLPAAVDSGNYTTVNAAFNTSQKFTSSNGLNPSKLLVEFDIKLSDEFFDSGHGTRHRFDLKFESFGDGGTSPWKTVTGAQSFVASGFDSNKGKWIHVSLDLTSNSNYSTASNSIGAMILGFRGITTTTQQTAWVLIDKLTLTVAS